jgi:hypothetical protein
LAYLLDLFGDRTGIDEHLINAAYTEQILASGLRVVAAT